MKYTKKILVRNMSKKREMFVKGKIIFQQVKSNIGIYYIEIKFVIQK